MKRTARKSAEKKRKERGGDWERGAGEAGEKGKKAEKETSGEIGNGVRARREKVKNGAENGRGRALAEKRGHIRIPRGKSGDVLIKREKRKAHGREKSGKNAKNIEISKKIIFKTFDMGGGTVL